MSVSGAKEHSRRQAPAQPHSKSGAGSGRSVELRSGFRLRPGLGLVLDRLRVCMGVCERTGQKALAFLVRVPLLRLA